MEEYLKKFPKAVFEDPIISKERQDSRRNKTYEEIFGKDEGKIQKEIRKISSKNQMKDENQILLRKEKCGKFKRTEEQINSMIKKKTKEWNNYRKKALQYYGEECQRCGSTKNLIVHHIDFLNDNSKFGNHNIENLMVLCKSCHSKYHTEKRKVGFTGISLVEKGAIYMLKGLEKEYGLNLNDVNFKDTPKRIARAYAEIFEGINSKKEINDILSTKFPTIYEGIVSISPIRCYSMCPHHFLPVIYDVSVGYIPKNGGLGLSKLPRLIELLAKTPKLQEDFTQEIVNVINDSINPQGCICIVKGEHMCMHMRGVKHSESITMTSAIKGCFTNKETRDEFMELIRK
jgi:GTP cyclohydrolase I